MAHGMDMGRKRHVYDAAGVDRKLAEQWFHAGDQLQRKARFQRRCALMPVPSIACTSRAEGLHGSRMYPHSLKRGPSKRRAFDEMR